MKHFSFFQPKSLAMKTLSLSFIFIALIAMQGLAVNTTWTGATNTEWNIGTNWSTGNVPTASDRAIIANVTNKPIITTAAVCSDLVIQALSTLTITSPGSLTVSGNWTNNGTFTAGTSIVTFNGTTQEILGSKTTAFSTITINSGSTVTGTTAFTAETFNLNDGAKFIQIVGGDVPGTTRNFATTSTYEWQTGGGVTFPSTTGISFGNLTINTLTGDNTADGNLTDVKGNLYIQETNTGSYTIATDVATNPLVIDGNLQIDFSTFQLSNGNADFTLFVNGNVIINGGTFTAMTSTGIPSIEVKGNWKNTGTYIKDIEPVTFSGTYAQTISGTTEFYDLTTSGIGLKTIAAGSAITVAGNLITNNLLVINSDETNSGSLIVKGTSTGNVTYNRWFNHNNMNAPTTPGYSRWYIASAPVNVTSGFGTSDNGQGTNASKIHMDGTDFDFATYSESSNDWTYVSEIPGTLVKGKGYLISLKPETDGILQFKGALNSNTNVTTTVNASLDQSWNAVGNPYTSALQIKGDAGFIQSNLTNLTSNYAAIYVWNETAGYDETQQYYKVIGSSRYIPLGEPGGTLSDSYVQAGQGFIINSKVNGTVKFTKAMQVHEPGLSLKSAETSWPGITLLAESQGRTRSTVVAFNDQMTNGLDVTYDAGLLSSSNFQLYTHLMSGDNPVDFAIQCLPDQQYSQLSVPVGVDLPEGGELVFKAAGIILPDGMYAVLEDKVLGTKTALKSESDSYTVTLDQNTSGIGRFYLSMGGDMALTAPKPLAQPNYTASFRDDRIAINGAMETGTRAMIYDVSGRKLGEYRLNNGNHNEITVSGMNQMVYLLKIEGKNVNQMIKVLGTKY